MTSQRTSPPWSGSGTGEYRRRRGGGASEASQETPWSFPAVLRTAPPRHFVPLPQQAGGEIQRGQSDVSPVERQRQGALTMTPQRTSPPWSGSGTGEYGRRPGGGASEASQETPWSFPAVLRTAPPRHFVPLPQQAGGEIQRGQSDVSPVERQRNGGVRPKAGRGRERSEPGDTLEFPGGPTDRAPSALRATPPASWGRNPKRPVGRLPRGAAATGGADDDPPKDFSPVERQRNGGARPKAGRGRERSEP